MLGNLLSSRAIQAGLIFFALVVSGSLLYSWHVHRTTESELASDAVLSHLKNREGNQTDTPAGQAAPTGNEPLVKNADTADATNTAGGQTKTGTDTPQEKSLEGTSVSDIEAEIIAEEGKAEEVLSAKERRHRELDKRLKEVHKKIEAIVAAAGGKITPETHPVETQQVARLQKELFQLMLEGTGDPMLRDFIAVIDARQRFQSRLSTDGEISVSEAFKIADFIETKLGNERGAAGIRTLAQYAIDNGSNVITQEHFDAEFEAPE